MKARRHFCNFEAQLRPGAYRPRDLGAWHIGVVMCVDHDSTMEDYPGALHWHRPCLSGAVAVLSAEGTLEALADTPTLVLHVARGNKATYDVPGLAALLEPYAGLQCHVLIEESQAMPGQGTRSMLTIGFGYGLWRASLPRCGFPIAQCGRPCGSAAWGSARTRKLRDCEPSSFTLGQSSGLRSIMAELKRCCVAHFGLRQCSM